MLLLSKSALTVPLPRRILPLLHLCILIFAAARLPVAAAQSAPAFVNLQVTVVDENSVAVPAARLTLSGPQTALHCIADHAGRCDFSGLKRGAYTLRVEKPGFYVFTLAVSSLKQPEADETPTLEVVLTHQQEVKEVINVTESVPAIDPTQASSTESLSSTDIVNIPYPTTRDIRTVLPLIPGVVADNSGQIHVAGSSTYQTLDVLDGFNITHPVTGLLDLRVSADAVRSVDIQNSRYSAEFGKASGGLVGFRTGMGDDRLRFSATNFAPSFQFQRGFHFDKWVPRATLSGPLRKGKIWFFLAPDGEYDSNIHKDLPRHADSAPLWRASNLAKLQVNLSPANILTGGFLFNRQHVDHAGLSRLVPLETTPNLDNSNFLYTLKDQHSFSNEALVEVGLALLNFRGQEEPLGSRPFLLTPEGSSGNFFRTTDSRGHRAQVFGNIYLPAAHWLGRHEWKLGVDGDQITYHQFARRTPVSVLREDGTPYEQIVFPVVPQFKKNNVELGAYATDRWFLSQRFLVEAGFRFDWDEIIRDLLVSPRLASTYALSNDTKFSLGVGLFYDATNLDFLTRPQAGPRLENFYAADGRTLLGVPDEVVFHANPAALKEPRSLNWSLAVEHKLPNAIYLRAEFLQKNSHDGFAYVNQAAPGAAPLRGDFLLENSRRDRYDAFQVTLRHTFKNNYFLLGAYTRSSARSSSVLDYSIDNPLFSPLFSFRTDGPQAWDTPNRLLSWGWLPLIKHFDISYILEWRNGFPFSVINQKQEIIGKPNSQRFPHYFNLAPYIERRFRLAGLNLAVRGGFDNITAHRNPLVVNNNIDSPDFMKFLERDHRTFTARIRFLGRK